MNAKTRIGLEILETALLLGLLGNALLRATPWGLNVLLWIGALVFAMATLTWRRKRELRSRETIALHVALIVFAGFIAWRDSIALQSLDVLIILSILAILSLPALKINLRSAGFLQYMLGAAASGLNAAFALLVLIFGDIEWKTIPRNGWTKHLLAVVRGLAIAAPILLIFGALFMAADAVFEGVIKNTFQIKPDVIFSHVLLFSFLAWICAGYLRGALFGSILNNNLIADDFINQRSNKSVDLNINNSASSVVYQSAENDLSESPQIKTGSSIEDKNLDDKNLIDYFPDFIKFGAVEVSIVLGLINLLFLSFVIVQLRYFFGGMDFVQTTENFKLAEYARRGFFELCWVAALMLPILLTVHFLLKKNHFLNEKIFRVLSAVNIGLLFIIMYSAVNRMLLYTGNLGYGMTTMRFYPTAFMLWLALVFLWFGLTVLRGQTKHFAWGALWMALFVVAGLHILNPDNFIVNHNLKLMEQGRQFDADYNSRLSSDASPALNKGLSQMSFDDRCRVATRLIKRIQNFQPLDFRTFNYSRWTEKNVLLEYENGYNTESCPEWMKQIDRDIFEDSDEYHGE